MFTAESSVLANDVTILINVLTGCFVMTAMYSWMWFSEFEYEKNATGHVFWDTLFSLKA